MIVSLDAQIARGPRNVVLDCASVTPVLTAGLVDTVKAVGLGNQHPTQIPADHGHEGREGGFTSSATGYYDTPPPMRTRAAALILSGGI